MIPKNVQKIKRTELQNSGQMKIQNYTDNETIIKQNRNSTKREIIPTKQINELKNNEEKQPLHESTVIK